MRFFCKTMPGRCVRNCIRQVLLGFTDLIYADSVQNSQAANFEICKTMPCESSIQAVTPSSNLAMFVLATTFFWKAFQKKDFSSSKHNFDCNPPSCVAEALVKEGHLHGGFACRVWGPMHVKRRLRPNQNKCKIN